MIFDTSILSPVYLGLGLGMFVVTYALLHAVVTKKPISWRVRATGKPLYWAGWMLAFLISISVATLLHDKYLVVGLLGATLIAILIGRLDEERPLSAGRQLFWQLLIAGWAVYMGWTIPYITNPFGDGVIMLFGWGSLGAFLWIILCMNAMNFLDGTDGLATLTGLIAAITLAAISLLPATQDTRTLTISLIAAGGLAAFFLWNAPPARIYLGTSGSWFVGLIIALISTIGGGKIETAFVVLAIPILDALFVLIHRALSGKLPWKGDRVRHIHHRLQDAGVSPWGILMIGGVVTVILGYVGVIAPTHIKLLVLVVGMLVFFSVRFKTMKV